MADGLEPSHRPLSQPGWLMRILRSVALILMLEMFDLRQHFNSGGIVAPQFIYDDRARDIP